MEKDDLKTWALALIKDFVKNSPSNTLGNAAGDRAWQEPLVGFSRGSDPLFQEIKSHIGDFYWTPPEIFQQTFPDAAALAEELTVISWALPHIEETKRDNRRETSLPSERWIRARSIGDEANTQLRIHLVAALQTKGYQAMSPDLSPLKKGNCQSPRYGRSSTWSERHTAYACGLGTFGLCDGLITAAGKAVRFGSIIARIAISPTERPYKDHHAYCLSYAKDTCRKCSERCPVGAITPEGHDKVKCGAYLNEVTTPYAKKLVGLDAHGCGLCQTGVPCESRIPLKN